MTLNHHCRHHFDGALVVNALTWTNIQFVRNRIRLLLAIPWR